MKNQKEEVHAITARILKSDYEQVMRISNKRKMSEAQVIRMLIEVGVECHKDMENLGLIGIIDISYYVKEAIKNLSVGKQLPLPL